jgi:hypothetical protein
VKGLGLASSKWESTAVSWDDAPKARKALLEKAWSTGQLSWKLNPNQDGVYQALRAWEVEPAAAGRLYALDISRRWGKSFTMILMAFEDAIRNKKWRVVYCAPTHRMVQKILHPLIAQLLQDCPQHYRPEYMKSTGTYHFAHTGSVVEIVGMDVNPDSARGTGLDKAYLDECGFFENLEYILFSILYPQMQLRAHARMVAGSTPPVSPSHYWSSEIIPAAINGGWYQKRVIDDNPMLSEADISEFVNANPGGRNSITTRREYYCEHIADSSLAIIPEWLDASATCIREVKPPKWRDCYVAMDPGWRDLTAVLFGYWWFEEKTLVIEDEIAEAQQNSRQIAEAIIAKEKALWHGVKRRVNNSNETKTQPYRRVSDNDHRLIHDLTMEHRLAFVPTQKDNLEQQVNAVRIAVSKGKIVIHPRCVKLNLHLRNGVWKNEHQNKFGHGAGFGHYDLIPALVYMLRNVEQNRNPYPPMDRYVAGIKLQGTSSGVAKNSKWSKRRAG